MKGFAIPLLAFFGVSLLSSGVYGEPATFYEFETTYIVDGKTKREIPGKIIVSNGGRKFESILPSDELESSTNQEMDIVSFDANKDVLYDIDPSNEEYRVIDKEMVKRQKRMMDEMGARVGAKNPPAMGSGQNQALVDALNKIREIRLQALQQAKGQGDLPPDAEREMTKRIGPPADPPEIKKTGKSQRTKWWLS